MFNVIGQVMPSHPHFFNFVKTYLKYFNDPEEYNIIDLIYKINIGDFHLITFGYICDFVLESKSDQIKIEYFMVAPEHQGTGIGKFCLNTLILYIKYYTHIDSIVLECKQELVPFYQKCGGKIINIKDNFFTLEIKCKS